MTLPSCLTLDQVMVAAQEQMFGTQDMGFCMACGEEAWGVEPDARHYPCETCGERMVYGAPEILIMIA